MQRLRIARKPIGCPGSSAESKRALSRWFEAEPAAAGRHTGGRRRAFEDIAELPRARQHRRRPSGLSNGSSNASSVNAAPAQPPQGLHPESRCRRPQGVSADRRVREWRTRRDLHRHAQGGRRLPLADEQFRHRDLHWPAIRRAAGGICRSLHLHPLRTLGHSRGQ